MLVANDRLLLFADNNPFWTGADPFVVCNALHVPFSVYGKLLLEHVDGIQMYINEFINIMLDSLKFSVLKPLAVDVSLVDDIQDIIEGLFPGKMFKFRGPNAIQEVNISGPGQPAFSLAGILDQEHQNGTGVTEFLAGLPSSRGRATATETEIKTGQGAGFFAGIIADIDNRGFTPLFEKSFHRTMQFMDEWGSQDLQQVAARYSLNPAMLDPVRRHAMMRRPIVFHSSGLNAALRRAETLEKILRLMEVLGNRPEFLQRINSGKLFDKIMEAFDFQELVAQPGGPMEQPQMPGAMPGTEQAGGEMVPDQATLEQLAGNMLQGGNAELRQ